MSQIASFTYLKESDVPFLGFWSKPKPRFFRKPENKFTELLRQHTLRESVLESVDGVYVALAFAWLELTDRRFKTEADPVLKTLRRQVGGSHWLMKFNDVRGVSLLKESLPQSDWPSFLHRIGVDEENYAWPSFEAARHFVFERLSDLKSGEALLVSVG